MKNTIKRLFNQDLNQAITMPQLHKPLLRSLEQRIVLDAAAVETGMDAADQAVSEQQAHDYITEHQADDGSDFEAVGPINGQLPTMRRDEIVFIDPDFENFENLLATIDPAIEVIVLDRDSDGIEQIAEALEGWDDLSSVHIFAGGEGDDRNLGSTQLNAETIREELADDLAAIDALSGGNSELLIYTNHLISDVLDTDAQDNLISGEGDNLQFYVSVNDAALFSNNDDGVIDSSEDRGAIASTLNDIQDLSRVEDILESQNNKVRGTLHDLFANDNFGSGSAWAASEETDYMTAPPVFLGDKLMVSLGSFDDDDTGLDFNHNAPLSYDAQQAKDFLESLEDRKEMLRLYMNSYVRHSTLYVSIDSNDKYFDDMQVEHYNVTLADGSPLPEWIKLDSSGFLSVKQLDNVEAVDLSIIAVLEDGTQISKLVTVETEDGSLTRLGADGDKVIYTQDFGDRI